MAGIFSGIDRDLDAPTPIAGNAWLEDTDNIFLPGNMAEAITRFSQSQRVHETLSASFQFAFSEVKKQELLEFERRVTDFELETYLSA